MRHGRHLLAAALAGPLALSLVAAAAPSAPALVGTATTTLSAAELTITSPVGNGSLGLVDATTFASTASDTAVNPAGGPFASAVLTPLTGPNGPVGRTEARSDGATSATSVPAALSGLGGPIADLAGSVGSSTLSATATATEAQAVIGALTAEIAGLASALGVDIETSDVTSRVDASGATATQGIQVSDLSVTLGDIVPQDVLASLPLPDLLALLESLPIDLPTDVQALIDELQAAIAALLAQLGDVDDAAAAVADALADLEDATDALGAVTSLTTSLDALEDIDPNDLAGGTLGGTLGGIGGSVDDVVDVVGGIGGTVGGVVGGVGGLVGLQATGSCGIASVTTAVQLENAIDCVEGLIDDTLAAVGVDTPAELQALITTLTTTVTTLVRTLVETIEGIETLLGDLLSVAVDLDDLLGSLTGLLGDAAGLPLVSVSSFDVGLNSSSDGTAEGSRASVGCEPVTVTILGESLTTPGCDQGLSAVQGTAALVGGLLGSLTDTLNALPLTEVVTTGDLKVDLFTDLQESVVEQGDKVVATAGLTLLDLEVPSVTIDPGPVTDLLDQLGLPDVLGTVEGLLGDTLADVQALGLSTLGTVTTTLTTATADLDSTGGIADLVGQLEGILAGLDLGDLGTLDSISTPSVALVIDPVSTASFTAAAPTDPTGGPAPAPTPGPSLPATGGGLAVLGLATLAGAASLLRRRG